MKKLVGMWLGLSFFVGSIAIAAAQENMEGVQPPPKVLVLYREFLKPGKAGKAHEKAESAFVQASINAKWPTHYIAVDSVSGKPRSLFLYGFDSFEAWEKDYLASQKNSAFANANSSASLADGELLSEMDSSVLSYREDQSLHPNVDIAHMRYFEISLYQVRSGHVKDWDDLVKMVTAAYEKIPGPHWAMYQVSYGQQPNTTYVIFRALKSASEIDRDFAQDKDFVAAMGEDGMKKLSELEISTIESRQSNLFAFNPRMSYPTDEWIKADPDFWKPKMKAPTAPKKDAEKPAGVQ